MAKAKKKLVMVTLSDLQLSRLANEALASNQTTVAVLKKTTKELLKRLRNSKSPQ
jgi:hypothetical protein